MALSWINFNNGGIGLDIRNSLNTFNAATVVDVNANTLDIVALYNSVAANLVKINTNIAGIATNVTNIGLLDGRVTITEADIVALESPEYTDYTPQVAKPTYDEGRLFYTDECKDICVYTDVTDVAISLGQQTIMRVINNTGSTITKGKVCTYAGASGGFPLIKLALADTFTNAIVLGVAYHDIPNLSTGMLVSHGKIKEMNTSGKTAGVPYFLSDTVPGEMELVPGNIVSQVGGVTDVSLTEGVFQVNARSNVALPTSLGIISEVGINSYNLTAVEQNIVAYLNETNVLFTLDKLLGTIQVLGTGIGRANFTASYEFVFAASTRALHFVLHNLTQAVDVGTPIAKNIPRDATEDSVSVSLPISMNTGDVFVIRVSSTPDMTISFTSLSFDIETVNVR